MFSSNDMYSNILSLKYTWNMFISYILQHFKMWNRIFNINSYNLRGKKQLKVAFSENITLPLGNLPHEKYSRPFPIKRYSVPNFQNDLSTFISRCKNFFIFSPGDCDQYISNQATWELENRINKCNKKHPYHITSS